MVKIKHKFRCYFERVALWVGFQMVNSACNPLAFQPPEPSSLEKYKVIK